MHPTYQNPRAHLLADFCSGNKRGIAGSLIWVNFDRHGLLDLIYQMGGQFVANVDDVRPQFRPDANAFLSDSAIYQSTLVRDNGVAASATIDQLSGQIITSVSGIKEVAKPWYSDQVLPFDITLSGVNEQGAATAMRIFGVEILKEGSGVSIDDAVTEMQATFVARFVEPWKDLVVRRVNRKSPYAGESAARASPQEQKKPYTGEREECAGRLQGRCCQAFDNRRSVS